MRSYRPTTPSLAAPAWSSVLDCEGCYKSSKGVVYSLQITFKFWLQLATNHLSLCTTGWEEICPHKTRSPDFYLTTVTVLIWIHRWESVIFTESSPIPPFGNNLTIWLFTITIFCFSSWSFFFKILPFIVLIWFTYLRTWHHSNRFIQGKQKHRHNTNMGDIDHLTHLTNHFLLQPALFLNDANHIKKQKIKIYA